MTKLKDKQHAYDGMSDTARLRVQTVRDILKGHPTIIIWSQKGLARYLARRLYGVNDAKLQRRMNIWIRTTGRQHLSAYILKDPISGHVQGLADPKRLAACLPYARMNGGAL